MTRAFMFAGALRVIVSLWKVGYEAAQEYVKSQEKWKHPYAWAAWVLWGLGD